MSQLAFVASSCHCVPPRRGCLLYSLRSLQTAIRSLLHLLFLGLNEPTYLSLCSYVRCSRGHLGGLCWTRSSTQTSLLCQKAPNWRQYPRCGRNNCCPCPHGYNFAITVQYAVGFATNTLLFPFQLLVYWDLQVFFCNTASIVRSVWLHGIIFSLLQDTPLVFTETQEVPVSPLFQPVKVPQNSIPALERIDCSPQLSVAHKLADHALHLIVWAVNKDIECSGADASL